MYSFSSASHICEPFPRTMNGGSPPTEPNARTGEFTPPGIMLAARCCRRRECSVLRDVMDGIRPSRRDGKIRLPEIAIEYYNSRIVYKINQIFIVLRSICNITPVPSHHQVALLTGRVC